jgi:hypothetical protein
MITDLIITQDNIVDDCNLLAVHSPLLFICSVDYDSELNPVYVNIYDAANELIASYQALVYEDNNQGRAKVYFYADSILRAYMGGFDDTLQLENELVQQQNMTKQFTIEFADIQQPYVGDYTSDSCTIVAYAGAVQFGENPALIDIFSNAAQAYVGAEKQPVYVYFYNSLDGAGLAIEGVDPVIFYARDYDAAIFTDYDGQKFFIRQ